MLVSIITPILNSDRYLSQCIESVLSQTYPYIEHLFVDGGSIDGTLDILKAYGQKYPERIRCLIGKDKCTAEGWNKGFTKAKGQIFGWLGADDIYPSNSIETVVRFFADNPRAAFVYGGCNYIDGDGKVIGRALARDFHLGEAINTACYIPCPSAFYRRELVNRVGEVDTREKGAELDYWIRAGKLYKLHRIDTMLADFRVGGFSSSKEANRVYAIEGFRISRRHGGRIISHRALLYLIYKCHMEWVLPMAAPIYRKLRR